jgi:hypothetical protein
MLNTNFEHVMNFHSLLTTIEIAVFRLLYVNKIKGVAMNHKNMISEFTIVRIFSFLYGKI